MGKKPKTRIEGDAEVLAAEDVEQVDEHTVRKKSKKNGAGRKQRQLFTMTAEQREKAMKEARAELLLAREAFEGFDDELQKLKRTHKTAEDRFEGAKDRLLAIALDEAAP